MRKKPFWASKFGPNACFTTAFQHFGTLGTSFLSVRRKLQFEETFLGFGTNVESFLMVRFPAHGGGVGTRVWCKMQKGVKFI